MLEDVVFVVQDYLLWLKRRTGIFCFSVGALFFLPVLMAKSVVDYARGKGYFSDPRGKPRLLKHWREMTEFILSAVILRTKQATEDAFAAAKNAPTRDSGDGVTVQLTDEYLEFQPPEEPVHARNGRPLVGVIIIPGAFVSPFAYSILARTLAQKGHPAFIVRLPFDLAFYGWDTAGKIIKRPPRADRPASPTKWVLVGHSLGSMGVSAFTVGKPECVHGVVFMGSGNRTGGRLSSIDVPALVIRGSYDPFTLEEDMQKSAHLMPRDTETFVVEGGNHRGFACYSRQPLDWEATITPAEQQRAVVGALLDFINRKVV